MQNEVYEGTVRLDRVPADQRTHNDEIEASRLGGKQSQIVVEVDKALLLLHDDGSAAAFIEATEQMRNDMRQIEGRLAKIELGKITQTIEEDVIAALKEMVAALKKAQKDQGKKKMPPGQPLQSQSQEPPLVDVLAELRMVRALQMRVNHRTRQFSKMIEGEQAENAELIEELRQLAEREQRIQRVTRDLEMGKNQ
jgi:predicted RNase H-like nuclease (RuvC/YqgF family)